MREKVFDSFRKKWLLPFICLVLALGFSGAVYTEVWAADTVEVKVDVTYGQTEARTMLEYINKFRAGQDVDGQKPDYWNSDDSTKIDMTGKLSPLTYDYDLERTAMQRAAEVAVSFAHTRPNGEKTWTAWSNLGWNYKGENIAAGYTTAYSTFKGWREDNDDYSGQGHRRNMLNENFTRIGIGHVKMGRYDFWTQAFGSGAGDDNATAASDIKVRVAVQVLQSDMKNTALYTSPGSLAMEAGETKALPEAYLSFSLSETWPSGTEIIGYVTPVWTVADTNIAGVTDGNVSAKYCGSTTLTASAAGFSKDCSVTVNHKPVEVPAAAATCTAAGLTAGEKCSVCGQVLTAQEVIPALGHSWDSGKVTVEPTGNKPGIRTYTCTRCGNTRNEEIEPTGIHTWDAGTVTKEPTCTEEGEKTFRCTDEDCTASYTEVIPATGHSYGEWKVTKEATCTEAGSKERTCSACGVKETEDIPVTEHHFGDWSVTKPATCTEDGSRERACTDCGETVTESIPATGHHYGDWVVTKEASLTETGERYKECTACGDKINETIPKLQPDTQTITAKVTSMSFTFSSAKAQSKVIGLDTSKAHESIIYKSDDKRVYGKDGKIYVTRSAPAKTYKVTIQAPASADGSYKASNMLTITVKVVKAANTLKVSPTKKTFKAAKVKRKAQSFKIKVSKAQGKVTYKSSNKKVKVTSTGKVTIKKGTKKGRYRITVTAAGNSNYNKGTKTVVIVVK